MKRSLWILIDHPMQIVDAVGLCFHYRDNYEINLLISKHAYWNKMDATSFFKFFKNVYWFPRINFSWIFPREILKIIVAKFKVSRLSIKPQDVFLVLSENIFLEGMMFNTFPKVKKIRLLTEHLNFRYQDIDFENSRHWREKEISKIWNSTIIPAFNMEPISYYIHQKETNTYRITYKNKPENVFDHLFILRQNGKPITAKNQVYELTPLVAKELISNKKTKGDFIIFFGNSLRKFNPYQIEFTNKCLRYIEKFFPDDQLWYKPHPNDKLELPNINLGKFKVFDEKISAELFFFKYASDIKMMFAISSTTLKNAIQLGFRNAYAFFKLYEDYKPLFRQGLVEQLGSLMKVKNFFITDLNKPPQKYLIKKFSIKKIKDNLKKVDSVL